MSNVAALTDRTAGLREDIMQSLNIRTVAYYIHRDQEALRDLVTIQREEFLQWLVPAQSAPTTAAPGPGDYFDAHDTVAGDGAAEILRIQPSFGPAARWVHPVRLIY